jgi:cell division protein FtsB
MMKLLQPSAPPDRTTLLEGIYLMTISLLLATVVATPVFIRHHLFLSEKIIVQEDMLEAGLIVILLLIAHFLSRVYKKELEKYRQKTCQLTRDNSDLSCRLTDAFKYIGGVNVQIQEIQSIFCDRSSYPATGREFKAYLAKYARKLLGMVNTDWVLIRVIDKSELRTAVEHFESRNTANVAIKGISNKAVAANQAIDGFSVVASRHENSAIICACAFPKKRLEEEEKILVEAVTNQIEMRYLIFCLQPVS